MAMFSARSVAASTLAKARARTTSRRNVALRWFDSTRVRAIPGDQILIGKPGKPAPDPMSITLEFEFWSGRRRVATKKDSPKWRVKISSALRIAVRFIFEFHFRII